MRRIARTHAAGAAGSRRRAAAAAPAQPPAVKAGWVVQDMRTPESVYLDEGSGYLFVSQIDGQPNEKDGKGRISKLGLDGTVVTADWFTALNAPKGLRSFGGTLWVADLDEVIGIDIASAKENARDQDRRREVPQRRRGRRRRHGLRVRHDGQQDLRDQGREGDGLCGRGAARISERLVRRGRAAGRRRLGHKPEADFTTKVPGHLYALDLKTKQKTLITKQPLGNIDGVEQEARGGYLVTDYLAGKLIQVSPTGESRVVRTFKPGLADHTFLYAQGDILIAPHMNENTVAAYDISADMK